MSNQEDQKEPKIVVYRHYEVSNIWVWELHGLDEKIHYSGECKTFNEAYESAKKGRNKYNRKIDRKQEEE